MTIPANTPVYVDDNGFFAMAKEGDGHEVVGVVVKDNGDGTALISDRVNNSKYTAGVAPTAIEAMKRAVEWPFCDTCGTRKADELSTGEPVVIDGAAICLHCLPTQAP